MSVLCVILGKRVYVLMSAFSHNQKITNPKTITKEKTSNCVDKAKCLLSQNCLINNIICKAVLTSTNPFNKEKVYFGTAETTFSLQYSNKKYKTDTELLNEVWQMKSPYKHQSSRKMFSWQP